jgi:hypothetical protein
MPTGILASVPTMGLGTVFISIFVGKSIGGSVDGPEGASVDKAPFGGRWVRE